MIRRLAVLLAVLAGLGSLSGPASAAQVAYVVDGDTIRLHSGVYVRLIGIDTPEVGQCGYAAAKRALDRLVGSTVRLPNPASTDDRDHYGRLLRYVRVGRTDAGLMLIRRGLADARYDGTDGYDWHPRQAAYHQADTTSKDRC